MRCLGDANRVSVGEKKRMNVENYCHELRRLIRDIGEGTSKPTLAYVIVPPGDTIPPKIWDIILDARDHGVEFRTTGNPDIDPDSELEVHSFALFPSTLN